MSNSKEKGIEKLQEDMSRYTPAYRFDMELPKTEVITMRVTKPMKDNIKIAAHRYGLSVTEYLTQLHRIFSLNCPRPNRTQE